jgi:hypothetical protein
MSREVSFGSDSVIWRCPLNVRFARKRTMSHASAAEAALKLNPRRPAATSRPWFWTVAFGEHGDRTPTRGYEPTREPTVRTWGDKSACIRSRRSCSRWEQLGDPSKTVEQDGDGFRCADPSHARSTSEGMGVSVFVWPDPE